MKWSTGVPHPAFEGRLTQIGHAFADALLAALDQQSPMAPRVLPRHPARTGRESASGDPAAGEFVDDPRSSDVEGPLDG